MGGFIVILLVTIGLAIISTRKKAQQQAAGQKGFGENFPFPDFDFEHRAELRDQEPIDQAIGEEIGEEGNPTTYRPAVSTFDAPLDDAPQVEKRAFEKFDLRKAVIYSEILKPKYKSDDDIF